MGKKYLITGGAGFIGSNYVARLLKRGEDVTIYDNLSRAGAPRNLAWLRREFGGDAVNLTVGDVRDASLLTSAAAAADIIIHLASQVAVTTSVLHPREDFEVNALGTFNVLEAARLSPRKPTVLYASTNKVYGGMDEVAVAEGETSYYYPDLPLGASESQTLDFHSPYGCSKGAGDQYVRDYHRIYDLPTVVFRQSCIYGPRQFGIEDQGWVAWFVIAAITGRPITIYGDGKQVRDVLYVEDLLDAYDLAVENISVAQGQVYNVGGGSENTLSIWQEFGSLLEELLGREIPVTWDDWRPGDQRVFIADIRKAKRDLDWAPKTDVKTGVTRLFNWVKQNQADW
ncbi:MAG: CDP-paratose 2-epimerase [Chloroflexi bacterium]|nr:CDP-paratose 2-epimerase [Chloroflexota bacterium]